MSWIFHTLWCFDILRNLLAMERTSLFLELPKACCEHVNQSCVWAPMTSNSHIWSHISPFLNYPRARYQTTRNHIGSPKPSEMIQISELFTLTCLLFRNSSKSSGLDFHHASVFWHLGKIWCFLCGPAWYVVTLSLRPVNIINFFWVLFSFLFMTSLTLPYHIE